MAVKVARVVYTDGIPRGTTWRYTLATATPGTVARVVSSSIGRPAPSGRDGATTGWYRAGLRVVGADAGMVVAQVDAAYDAPLEWWAGRVAEHHYRRAGTFPDTDENFYLAQQAVRFDENTSLQVQVINQTNATLTYVVASVLYVEEEV